MTRVIREFEAWRKWLLIPLAFFAGGYCMYLDSERERSTMLATVIHIEKHEEVVPSDPYKKIQTTFSGQVARACEAPDFQSRWLWNEMIEKKISIPTACKLDDCETLACSNQRILVNTTRSQQYHERVDRILKLEKEKVPILTDDYLRAPTGQWLTELLLHLEDMILISMGWLIFLQCVAHPLFFWNFEHLSSASQEGEELSLKLNCTSELHEFGLEHWNHALNNLYWYFSVALIIPFLSRMSQPNLADLDTSQQILEYAIPALVATPMIATILARQSRLPGCFQKRPDEEMKVYMLQRLWPLDKNWSSKLGIVLVFILLSISFGVNMTKLL